MSIEQEIRELTVTPRTVACLWLGQASYLFKSPQGVIVMIDPYLSDWAEDQWGLTRQIPPIIDPNILAPDLLLVSHWHEDHFDVPVVKKWAKLENPGQFVGPPTCTVRMSVWGWPQDRIHTITTGGHFQHEDVRVTATFARHDTPFAPTVDEVGFLLDIGGFTIWYVGDTEYDARLRPYASESIDVAFVPINGVGGNIRGDEAALLMTLIKPRVAIPMHYNMWRPEDFGAGATLDPEFFRDTHRKLDGTAEIQILPIGELVTLGGNA